MFCVKCGEQLADDAKFCSKCGGPQLPSVSKAHPTSAAEYERFSQTNKDGATLIVTNKRVMLKLKNGQVFRQTPLRLVKSVQLHEVRGLFPYRYVTITGEGDMILFDLKRLQAKPVVEAIQEAMIDI